MASYAPPCRTHHEEDFRELTAQLQSVQSKLTTKTEALLRVGRDLEEAEEREKKLRAQSANYERNLQRTEIELAKANHTIDELKQQLALETTNLNGLLDRLQIRAQSLDVENAALHSEVRELQKDCKTYRQKVAKMELANDGGFMEGEDPKPIRANARMSSERLSDGKLDKYEKLQHEHAQLVSDFQTLLTLKEESVTDRDELMKKVERLSSELSFLLNGDSRRVAEDLDGLLAENRFLKAQLSNANEESETIKATLAKYRAITENKHGNEQTPVKPKPVKIDDTLDEKSSVAVINMKQIREMLASHAIELSDGDYRALVTVLLDLSNDKQMALAHQRRANKILGARLAEVEAKLAKLEASKSPRSSSPYLQTTSGTS